jgi:hypothetical protein
MDTDRIQLDALELLLNQEVERLDLTGDQIAKLYERQPESHVFFGSDFDEPDAHEVINVVMTNDVSRQIRWHTDTIALLRDEKRFAEELGDREGYADMVAEMLAERRAGC